MTFPTISERFEDTPIDLVVIGHERWVRGASIGQALGFADPKKSVKDIYTRNQSEFDDSTTLVIEMPTAGGRQLVRLYNARGAALIAMKAQTPKGEAFRRWVLDVLEGKADADAALPGKAGEMTPGVLHSLRTMFLARRGNTALLKYREMGLGPAEIARLLEVKPASVNPRLRVAEFLGLLDPPADLAFHQNKPTFHHMIEAQQRGRKAYVQRQAAKALPAPADGEDA